MKQHKLVRTGLHNDVTLQHFEWGQMFLLKETNRVYVLWKDGMWASYQDDWQPALPESDPDIVSPSPGKLYQPVRSLGRVWREQLNGPKSWIGWAIEESHSTHADIESFVNGMFISLNEIILILYEDGTWIQE